MKLFKTVLICRIGRGIPYNEGVSPGGKKYYDAILGIAGDKFSPHVMAALGHFEISSKLHNTINRKHAKAALEIVKQTVINARLLECLDYLLANIDADPSCANSGPFKKLSAGYIN
jgi:hypothetical protein